MCYSWGQPAYLMVWQGTFVEAFGLFKYFANVPFWTVRQWSTNYSDTPTDSGHELNLAWVSLVTPSWLCCIDNNQSSWPGYMQYIASSQTLHQWNGICIHVLHVKTGFPEIRNSSTLFTRIRNLGEALQMFRIPVKSVRKFRIPVETTAIPDSSIQYHSYSGFQWLCYIKTEQVASSHMSQQRCFHDDASPRPKFKMSCLLMFTTHNGAADALDSIVRLQYWHSQATLM